jgi:hypothetical protein
VKPFERLELAIDLRLLEANIAPTIEEVLTHFGEEARAAVAALMRAVYLQGYGDAASARKIHPDAIY